jgi:hypothetical protein
VFDLPIGWRNGRAREGKCGVFAPGARRWSWTESSSVDASAAAPICNEVLVHEAVITLGVECNLTPTPAFGGIASVLHDKSP